MLFPALPFSLNASTNSIRLKNNTFITGNTEVSGEVLADTYRGISVLNSTSVATGSVVLAGGLGVAKTIFADIYRGVNTLDSTSISTGSAILSGGLGVAKSVFATTYSSPNGAFKNAHFKNASTQTIASGGQRLLIFPTQMVNNIPQLSYSSGTFTVSIAMRLFISYSLNYVGGGGGVAYAHIETSDHTTWFGISGSTNMTNAGLNGSCIVALTAGATFKIYTEIGVTQNISGNDTYAPSNCFVYSLN